MEQKAEQQALRRRVNMTQPAVVTGKGHTQSPAHLCSDTQEGTDWTSPHNPSYKPSARSDHTCPPDALNGVRVVGVGRTILKKI